MKLVEVQVVTVDLIEVTVLLSECSTTWSTHQRGQNGRQSTLPDIHIQGMVRDRWQRMTIRKMGMRRKHSGKLKIEVPPPNSVTVTLDVAVSARVVVVGLVTR